MTLYYVKKTGSDGAAGTSAGAAWLTIDKAANTVAAGDTVYVGAGVYRELVTMDTSGSSGSQISYIADITGEKTGDGGLVFITANDTETAAPTRAWCVHTNQKTYITWQDFVFSGGTTAAVGDATAASNHALEGVIFDGCVFLAAHQSSDWAFTTDINAGVTPTGNGLTLKNCMFVGKVEIPYDTNASAHTNLKWTVENNVFIMAGASLTQCVRFEVTGSGSFTPGGAAFNNNTFIGGSHGVYFQTPKNTTNPFTVRNNIFFVGDECIGTTGSTAGAVLEDYNLSVCSQVSSISNDTPVTNGGNSDVTIASPMLLGGIADLPLIRRMGWSPFRPWEPISMSGLSNVALGFASASYAPADDLYGSPRPMGRNTDDVGAVENRTRPARESTTVNTGTYAANFQGAGYYDSMRAVSATSTTITVYCRKDGNYTGPNPKLEVVNIPGVADQSDSLSVASGNWEQLSVNFTPTSAGWVRVRLWSYDTSATGKCFFDDLVVA